MKRYIYILFLFLFVFQSSLLTVGFINPQCFFEKEVHRIYRKHLVSELKGNEGALKKIWNSKIVDGWVLKWLLHFYEPAESVHVGRKLYEKTARSVRCGILYKKYKSDSDAGKELILYDMLGCLFQKKTKFQEKVESFMRDPQNKVLILGSFFKTFKEKKDYHFFIKKIVLELCVQMRRNIYQRYVRVVLGE